MKKILNILLVIFACSVLVACVGEKKSETASKIYVGTNAEFAPFEYLEKDEIVGFDIDLLKAAAEEMNLEIEIKDMSFDGLLPALQAKKVDMIIAGMTATPEREKHVAFSNPYFQAKQVIVTDKNSSIKSFKDLVGKKVGVVLGFTGDAVVSEMSNVNIERYNSAYAAMLGLDQQKIDAVVLDTEPAKKYTSNYENMIVIDSDAAEEDYAIAVRKEDKDLLDKLNSALDTLKSNGKYDEIFDKYFK